MKEKIEKCYVQHRNVSLVENYKIRRDKLHTQVLYKYFRLVWMVFIKFIFNMINSTSTCHNSMFKEIRQQLNLECVLPFLGQLWMYFEKKKSQIAS
jgi:hypothetical protein